MSSPRQPGRRLVRERRTVALFQPEAPPRELLLAAVDAARWAPNHHLTEPWRFYLLGSKALRAMIDIAEELTLAKRGAGAAENEAQAAGCGSSVDGGNLPPLGRPLSGAGGLWRLLLRNPEFDAVFVGERPGLQVEHGRGDAG